MTVNEESTIVMTVTATDAQGDPVTLIDPTYILSDRDGNELKTGSVVDDKVVLSCSDLAIGTNGVTRVLLVKGTYNSTEGNGLCINQETRFTLTDLINV